MDEQAGRGIPDELLRQMDGIAAEMRAARNAGAALDGDQHAKLHAGYVEALRSRGWLQHVPPENLVNLLEVVVVRDPDGAAALDVESHVTDQAYLVPGWGAREVDPAEVGRGLAEDDGELLDDMRASGEITGWE